MNSRENSSNPQDHHMVLGGIRPDGGFGTWRARTQDEWCDYYEELRAKHKQLQELCDLLTKDADRLDKLETKARDYSRPPMRAVTGTEWSIIVEHEHGERPSLRQAIDYLK